MIVYWAISRPGPKTSQNGAPANPELSTIRPNTNAGDWWWIGTTTNTTTMSSTPTMCHHADRLLSIASRFTPSVLSSRCTAMIAV